MNELREAIANIIELASQSLDELDDETMLALADLLNAASQRLAQMQEQGAPPLQSKIESGMPSSNVEGFAYDPKTNKLMVRFLGDYPNRNGPIYAYEGVSPVIFDLLRKGAVPARTDGQNRWGKWWRGKTPSLGASLFTLIKNGGYPYQRLT